MYLYACSASFHSFLSYVVCRQRGCVALPSMITYPCKPIAHPNNFVFTVPGSAVRYQIIQCMSLLSGLLSSMAQCLVGEVNRVDEGIVGKVNRVNQSLSGRVNMVDERVPCMPASVLLCLRRMHLRTCLFQALSSLSDVCTFNRSVAWRVNCLFANFQQICGLASELLVCRTQSVSMCDWLKVVCWAQLCAVMHRH
jgi:hypothetical protein